MPKTGLQLSPKNVQLRSQNLTRFLPEKVELEHTRGDLFLNRELSWLQFNWRVLHEARDLRVPLLERVKFLSIASSNIDEFCMKRMGGLSSQIAAGVTALSVDGRTAVEQFQLCAAEILAMEKAKQKIYKGLLSELKREKIIIHDYTRLKKRDMEGLRGYYIANVHPLLTPQAIDISHPFPFISNLSLNLIVRLKKHGMNDPLRVRIKVPVGNGIPRFVEIPRSIASKVRHFVGLEDIIANNLDLLFPDTQIYSCNVFRITRNAITSADQDDAEDLVEMIESYLKKRKFAPVLRLQFEEPTDEDVQSDLAKHLGIDENCCCKSSNSMIGMADLMQIALLGKPALFRPVHHPVTNRALIGEGSIFSKIHRHQNILLQHPYECFETSVERFVTEASFDPTVRSIKMTIYRTSTDTKIVDALINAAQNGKQVAVVVELTASFDEQANIVWADRLERAGIHVSFGTPGLKTHCKIILVIRQEARGLRRYAHFGTGNYHARNARVYSDIGMLTDDPELTGDLGELFNYLTTGCAPVRPYQQLLTAPLYIKKGLLSKIAREARNANDGKKSLIRLKANALEDKDIVSALYQASQAGVKIELLIRDICRLRPGVKNMSDNVSVTSIVGRFLEHSRIYHFHNGGDDEYFIGSADLMSRNLERRVEVLIPVNDSVSKMELDWILNTQFNDQRCGWDMLPDGKYQQRQPSEPKIVDNCHDASILRCRLDHVVDSFDQLAGVQ